MRISVRCIEESRRRGPPGLVQQRGDRRIGLPILTPTSANPPGSSSAERYVAGRGFGLDVAVLVRIAEISGLEARGAGLSLEGAAEALPLSGPRGVRAQRHRGPHAAPARRGRGCHLRAGRGRRLLLRDPEGPLPRRHRGPGCQASDGGPDLRRARDALQRQPHSLGHMPQRRHPVEDGWALLPPVHAQVDEQALAEGSGLPGHGSRLPRPLGDRAQEARRSVRGAEVRSGRPGAQAG
mmetsp:Transcript_87157/g.281500  ORF Transcript_87157/g.281500 Transcript_87157/m.281500 type:complete len:238 (-) Transcript_87157:2175-2888(-)